MMSTIIKIRSRVKSAYEPSNTPVISYIRNAHISHKYGFGPCKSTAVKIQNLSLLAIELPD